MNKKRKALLLSTIASLALLTGCKKNDSIVIDGDTYVKSGEEYTKLDNTPKVYEPGTHITYYVFYHTGTTWEDGCVNIHEGFGNCSFNIPETPEGYSILNISDISASDNHTNGIIIFYVNTEKIEVTPEYDSETGLFTYDNPGKVVQEKVLEMGD